MMTASFNYSSADVLNQIDQCARKWQFIILDGGKSKPADVRMTIYRDDLRWAIVLEQLGFSPQSPGHWGISDVQYKIGNCISGKQGADHADILKVTSDDVSEPAFLPPYSLEVNPNLTSIRIRGNSYPVDLSKEQLRLKGISVSSDGILLGQHLLWSLLPEYREALLASEEERRCRLPIDIPKLLQLEEWHHAEFLSKAIAPSETETFQMLAAAIVSGDTSKYHPVERPNTHWKHWLGYERV